MNNKHLVSVLLSGVLLASCGGGGGGGGGSSTSKTAEPLETELNGIYQAVLSPVNNKVSKILNGSLTLVRERDEVIIDVRLSNGPGSSMHVQNIHVGDRCPTEADDLNNDGYIDAEEMANVVKEVLIPLDDDISGQWIGLGTFPVSDQYGYYFWSRAAKYEKMMADLRDEDINLTDDYIKIGAEKNLTMIGKVVVIRGVPDTTPLPETVSGRGRTLPRQGLPIACGVIKRLGKVPGVIDQDVTDIPVPQGETIGGSSGADDGADFSVSTSGGTTGGSSGNYGDDDDDIINNGGGVNGSNSVEPEERGSTSGGMAF